jgi:hypothetical protein
MPYTPKQFSGRGHPLQAKGSQWSSQSGRPKDLMLWLEIMDVSNRTLAVYILPRSVHVELQRIVNTLSVTQLCTYVPRFVGRMVMWATAEVEVRVGVFLINDVTQWAIRSPVNIHGWNMAVCLHGELNVWWTLFSRSKKPPHLGPLSQIAHLSSM